MVGSRGGADRRAAARSAALACRLAWALLVLARSLPQISGSQLAPMLARYWLAFCVLPPPPERVALPFKFAAGNSAARCSPTSALACA